MSGTNGSFDLWMQRVDAAVQRQVGVSVYDLPDCCFRDWYDDDLTPNEAAEVAIENGI